MSVLLTVAAIGFAAWVMFLATDLVHAVTDMIRADLVEDDEDEDPTDLPDDGLGLRPAAAGAVEDPVGGDGLPPAAKPPTVVDDEFLTASPLGVELAKRAGTQLTNVLELLGYDPDVVESITIDLTPASNEFIVDVHHFADPWSQDADQDLMSSVYRVPVAAS